MNKFNFLTILKSEFRPGPGRRIRWAKCRCVCGNEKWIFEGAVKNGHTKSCGCKHVLHGHTAKGKITPEWNAWHSMQERCMNPKNDSWKHYGGRGIRVCDRWQESFNNFFIDVGPRPGNEFSLDRIDNEGHYEPGNVRWATKSEQRRNMRPRATCKNGHPFTPETTYFHPKGGRRDCKICRAIVQRHRRKNS